MTHDILQTDIELAIKMRDDQRSDDEIILALTHRGVDLGPAAQLVEDLRKGVKPTSKSAIGLEFAMARRSRAKSVPQENEPAQPSQSSSARSRNGSRPHSASQGPKRTAGFRVAVVVFVGLVITAASVILIQRYKASTTEALEEQKPKAALPKVDEAPRAATAKAALPSTNAPPPALILELQPDGLHLGGSLVTGGNVLNAAANLLGVATRTNQVGQTDTVIYAYDRQGLLIYAQKSGGTNSIILDCEGSGGTNGTTFPFTGSLKLEDQVIGPSTDSQALAAIKKLELNRPGAGGSVWGGRYDGLDLVFAYLKSPQRLSFIEIDLK